MTDRLLVYTPTYGDALRPETAQSIAAQEFAGEITWRVSWDEHYTGGRDMDNVTRQYMAGRDEALGGGYDAMLCVEHDMVLPSGALQALYDTPAPVVYAAYMLRHGLTMLNLFKLEGRKNLGMSLSLYPGEVKRAKRLGVLEVSGAGFGCTLMRREALERAPFRMTDNAPDLPFAGDCLRRGIKQLGRMDVACGHIRPDGKVLMVDDLADGLARVLALQSVTVAAGDQSLEMKKDRYYSIPLTDARELERAGYVRITADPTQEEPGREVAVAPVAEKATAPAQKAPSKRTRRRRKSTPRAKE